MFGVAGRRLVEVVVGLFAALGFAFVPLGQKTALEHTVSIFTTPAARGAFQGLIDKSDELRRRFAGGLSSDSGPKASDLPRPDVPKLGPGSGSKRDSNAAP